MLPEPRTAAPLVFDRPLGRVRLARAIRAGYAGFLLERVVADALDRLSTVLRSFPRALDLGTPTPALARALVGAGRVGSLVRAAPLPEAPEAGWRTLVADEEALPFVPESFELAVSLFALHGANDLPGALAQARRSLAPDGLFLGCLLGGRSLHELRACLTEAECEIEGGASPRVAPFADLSSLGTLLQRAGLALPVTDLDTVTVRYDTPFGLMRDLRAMGLTNALTYRSARPLRRPTLLRAASLYAEGHADPDGRVRATFDLAWLSGWAPHESQQKPLRPGSAKTRLADALGAREFGREGEEPAGGRREET